MSVLVLCWGTVCVGVQADEYAELSRSEKLQAAYLFNFTKFIQWPDSGNRFARTSVNICIVASVPFSAFITELVEGKKVGKIKTPVVVSNLSANTRCDIVYVQADNFVVSESLEEVLLVAATPTILPDQATITFYEDNKRLRFEVDMREIERLKLKISSELLKLARIKKP